MTDVSANDETTPRFSELGLHPLVLKAVEAQGYEVPTPIQAETIPTLLSGRDVIGLAQTGTGKTAAFALPALSDLAEAGRADDGPFALVLTPTRELAIQVAEAFTSYATELSDFSVLPIYGGQAYGPQLAGLRRGAQVVVGTPGRVIDHLKKGSLKLGSLKHLILDEADEMLKMGFAEDIEEIFSQVGPDRQVALFSATMPSSIHRITGKYLDDPKEVRIAAKSQTGANIRQRYFMVQHSHKLDALTRILEVEEYEGIIMFVRTKQATEELAEKLRARGFKTAAINGDIPQQARERTIDMLREAKIDILVATDVAARGLDVERITLVVNYDIPHDTESYVHRIGRTGRAGRSGTAILFVSPRERHMLKAIEKATRSQLEEIQLPTVDDVNAQRVAKFRDSISESLGAPGFELFRRLIEDYERESDVPMGDIAAALALQTRNGAEFLMSEPPPEKRRERPDRPARSDRPMRRPSGDFATYRIDVGKRHKVMPGAIVGAIANEGGLHRSDFGHISIMQDFSLVELPPELPPEALKALAKTRIQGQLINLQPDRGPGARDGGGKKPFRGGDKKPYKGQGKKPHKHRKFE